MISSRLLSRPFFSVALILLLGLLIGELVFNQASHLKRESEWLTHTYVVIDTIDELLLKLTEAESSQRRFIMSQNDEALVSYRSVIKGPGDTISDNLAKLRSLITDNVSQQQRLEKLTSAVHEKIDFMNELIRYAPGKSLEEIKLHAKGHGVELMSEISAVASDMETEENRLLKIRTEEDEQVRQRIVTTCIALSCLLVLVLMAALITIQRELARRLAAEKALRANTAFQTALVENSPYAIIATDKTGKIKLFNPAAEAMLGYSAAEMIGTATPMTFHDPDEVMIRAAQLSDEFGQAIEPGFDVFVTKSLRFGPEQREWTYIRKDGSRLLVQLIVTSVPDEHGGVAGFFGIAEDITGRKNIERMKDEFISTVSHELRTPLTSIRGSLSLILANVVGPLQEKTRDLITIAFNNSERLVRLINDILDIEKIESGNFIVDLRPLAIDAVLRQAIEENSGYAGKYGVHLKADETVSDVFVSASHDHLLQVFANLISNAVKFSKLDDSVTLSAEMIGDMIRFSITDYGPGIPVEFQARIFEKFSQADSSDTRAKGGTGLGLSISKALMEKMNGTIGFDSVPGRTSFYIDLPLAHQAPLPRQKSGTEILVRKRVLIVEDDPDIASLLRLILSQEGLGCVVAYSARQAKRLLETETFIAMTLDLELPDQDGLLLIKELRAAPRTVNLPIVVISIRADEGRHMLNGHAVGILDWLQKPIDIERLQRVLRSIAAVDKVPTIIHVEDDSDMTKIISLSMAGKAIITHAGTLAIARQYLIERSFDLAILDIALPDGNGLDLIPTLADHAPPIPIIILSASETPKEVQKSVHGALVKSVVSEQKLASIVQNAITGGSRSWKS